MYSIFLTNLLENKSNQRARLLPKYLNKCTLDPCLVCLNKLQPSWFGGGLFCCKSPRLLAIYAEKLSWCQQRPSVTSAFPPLKGDTDCFSLQELLRNERHTSHSCHHYSRKIKKQKRQCPTVKRCWEILTWWRRIPRYFAQHRTPSAEPWPPAPPFAFSSGFSGCETGTTPDKPQAETKAIWPTYQESIEDMSTRGVTSALVAWPRAAIRRKMRSSSLWGSFTAVFICLMKDFTVGKRHRSRWLF